MAMPRTHDHAPGRSSTWILIALAPLLATGATLAGSLALAVAIPVIALAAAFLARMSGRGHAGRHTAAVANAVVCAALVAAMADVITAMFPAAGAGAVRWLPIAVVLAGVLIANDADAPDAPSARALLLAAAAGAVSIVILAIARDWAGRVSHVALSPAGAFVAIGCAIALMRAINAVRVRGGDAQGMTT
ncbi:MAG: hypothetical protein U1F09_05425 [Steroidobacteraceae bacterium]